MKPERITGQLVLPDMLTPTGLSLPDGLSEQEWEQVGDFLSRAEQGVQWWIGDWWVYGEHRYGDRAKAAGESRFAFQTLMDAGWVARRIETSRRREVVSWSHHKEVAALDPPAQDEWLERAAQERLSHKDLRQKIRHRAIPSPTLPEGRFQTIAIDPPWPVEKIVREVRHRQGPALDYPVMTLDQIAALPVPELASEAGCHIYLWVTHKFLPAGLSILEGWNASYECSLTWVKPVGITPFSWMYNSEHVLFARIGSLPHGRPGLKLAFEAPARGHSVKPDEFYERVVEASPEPRLEMFARRPREGFTVWGNEVTDAA